VLAESEIERFLDLAQRLPDLSATELGGLTIVARPGLLDAVPSPKGLF
jgi:2-methylcitrate dehydratase